MSTIVLDNANLSDMLDHANLRDVSALAGATEEVRKQLDELRGEQVVAVVLPHANPRATDAIAKTFVHIAQLVPVLIGKQQRKALETIVAALVPNIVPTPNVLKEAAMLARARTAVINSGDWMTANQIATVAGFSTSNPSAQPSKWKREKSIFAIGHNGVDYFPSYGLDPSTGYRPLKALSAILRVFDEKKDAWGLAFWFMSPNSFLGGKRPQELLATDPERVIEAATDELEEVAHA